jgi:putative ABC transport system ATP-binding protein
MSAAPDEVVLDVKGLTRVFGAGESAVHAVDGVDLTLRRGEVLLIMGPSGSGKTTLLSMIGGLLRPTAGSIRLAGRELVGLSEGQLAAVRRHQIGFVFQTFNLLSALSALENVEVALNLAGVSGRAAHERSESLLRQLGLGARLHALPATLSGGEQQRVSLARALANDPMLLLADEPTANLDSRHGQAVVSLLGDIARRQGHAVIIVSHDQRIRAVADRVLWLEDGRLAG